MRKYVAYVNASGRERERERERESAEIEANASVVRAGWGRGHGKAGRPTDRKLPVLVLVLLDRPTDEGGRPVGFMGVYLPSSVAGRKKGRKDRERKLGEHF